MNNLNELIAKINQFAQERDRDQFHSPKNLPLALSAEVSELMEEFLWRTGSFTCLLTRSDLSKV